MTFDLYAWLFDWPIEDGLVLVLDFRADGTLCLLLL